MTGIPKPFWAELRACDKACRGESVDMFTLERELAFIRRLVLGNTAAMVDDKLVALHPHVFARGIVEMARYDVPPTFAPFDPDATVTAQIERWIASSMFGDGGIPIFVKEEPS